MDLLSLAPITPPDKIDDGAEPTKEKFLVLKPTRAFLLGTERTLLGGSYNPFLRRLSYFTLTLRWR